MAGAAAAGLFGKRRLDSAAAAARAMGVYERTPRLAPTPLTDWAPTETPVDLTHCATEDWQVSTYELAAVVSLAVHYRPERVMEIGTFDGRTTLNLHRNHPGAEYVTVDLPPDEQQLPDGKQAGSLIRDLVASGDVEQLYGDSTRMDFRPYFGRMNFVFIDAGHDYRCAKADTQTALRLVEGNEGLVLWHDYGSWPGVTRAVDELPTQIASGVETIWVKHATLVAMKTKPGEPLRLR